MISKGENFQWMEKGSNDSKVNEIKAWKRN